MATRTEVQVVLEGIPEDRLPAVPSQEKLYQHGLGEPEELNVPRTAFVQGSDKKGVVLFS